MGSVFHSTFSFGSAGTGLGESHRLEVTWQVGGLWVLASGCSRVSVPGVAASLPPSVMGVLLTPTLPAADTSCLMGQTPHCVCHS